MRPAPDRPFNPPPSRDVAPDIRPDIVDVTYMPIFKGSRLGKRFTREVPVRRGENPYRAAERALELSFKARDFLILEARPRGAVLEALAADWSEQTGAAAD